MILQKTSLILGLIFCSFFIARGQNLIPNPDFGKNTACPSGLGNYTAQKWQSASLGTPDYFNVCSTSGDTGIPFNYYGVGFSFNGGAYSGLITKKIKEENYREYIQAELIDTTEEGCYEFEMWLRAADQTAFGNRLGILFTNYAFYNPFLSIVYTEPQIEITEYITQITNWYVYTTEVWLPSGMSHITIGNFRPDSLTEAKGGSGSLATEMSYVYIDKVILTYLSEEPNVNVDLGPDQDICPADYPIVLNSGVVNGEYLWSTGETSSTIEINGPGEYIVTAYDNCVSKSDTVSISTIPIPNFNLSPTYDICSGDTLFVDLDPSFGNYEWQDGSNAIHYAILDPGTYTTTLTHDCGTIIDSFSVSLLEPPVIETIDDVSVCQNDLPYVVDLEYLNTGYNDFYWSNGFTQDYNAIVSAGNFSVTVSNNCFLDTATFMVDVNLNLPYFIPFDDTLVCADEYFVILTTNKGNSYLWDNGETTDYLLAQGPGTYTVTITNACDTNIYNFIAKEIPPPEFDLGDEIFICEGDLVGLSPNTDFEDLEVSFEWNTGSIEDSITVNQAGVYWLSVTGECESFIDSITISYSGVEPEISFRLDITICEGASANISPSTGGLVYQYLWSTGSTNPAISVQNEGWYFVTATNNCGVAEDSVFVTVDGVVPVLALPETAEICSGDIFIYDLPVNDYELLWSTGDTDNHIELNTSGIYWLQAENDCGVVYDSIELTVIPDIPTPDLGNDLSLCQGASIDLIIDDPGTEINWSTGITDDSISISLPGSYWVSYSNSCFTYYDTIVIADGGNIPVVDLGSDVLLCEGDSVQLDIANAAIDTVLWSNGNTNSQIWLSEAGIYTVSAGNVCGETMDTIEISTYNDIPVIDLGVDLALCQGDSLELDLGNIPGNILWNTGETENSILVNMPGVYYVDVSSNCGMSTDTIEILDNGISPSFTLGPDAYLCPGDSVEFNIDPALGNISWNFGGNQSTIIVDEEGVFIATVTNNCGFAADTVEVVVYDGPPVVDLGPDINICEGDTIDLMINPGFGMISWSTGSNNNSISVSQAGMYSVMVSTNCGENADSVMINFDDPPPVFDLGSDLFICPGDSVTLTVDSALGSIEWNDGSSDPSYVVTEPGEVSVGIENNCGTGFDTLNVFENPLPSSVDLGPDLSICLGDTVLLVVNPAEGEVQWSDGTQSDSFLITQAGNYSVMISTICDDFEDEINVVWSDEVPFLDLGPDLQICAGDSFFLDSGFGNELQYEWNTNASTSGIYIQNEGIYWLEISNSCGTEIDSLFLSFEAPLPSWTLGNDTIICAGEELLLDSGLDPNLYQFNWNTGLQDETLPVQNEGLYWLEVSNACEISFDSIQVNYFDPLETVSLGPDLEICKGDTILLEVFQDPGYSYQWNNNWNLADLVVQEEGLYSVTVSNQCESLSDDIQINFNQDVFEIPGSLNILACENELIQLNVAQEFDVDYNWIDGSSNSFFNTTEAGNFEVSLESTCIDTIISFMVERKYCDDERMFIPNVFSPNGDGLNDFFSIGYFNGFDVQDFKINIFDRWGSNVFSADDPSFLWDGTLSGKALMQGVYVYVIVLSYQSEDGLKSITKYGDISILK